MPTSELISTAKTPADLEKAYASALKAVAKLGIKMAIKKPDAGKIGTAMTKAKKPAEFRLLGDRGIIKIQVETKDFSSVLGLLDVTAERDAEKRLIIIESLAAAGLMSAAELKAAKASAVPAVDPTVIKNYQKKLQELTAQNAVIATLKIDQVLKSGALLEKFRAFVKAEHSSENLDFLEAVDKKVAPAKIIATYINSDAPRQVNLPGPIQQATIGTGGAPNFDLAYKAIKALLASDPLKRFRTEMSATADKQIAALKAAAQKAGIPAAQL